MVARALVSEQVDEERLDVLGAEAEYKKLRDEDYYEAKELGMENFWRHDLQTFWKPLFFCKHEDWRDEMKWRFVVVEDVGGFVLVPFVDALKYVVAGVDARDKDVIALKRIAHSVPVLRLRFEPWRDDFVINV
jgi:hypothetical protein